MKTVKEVLVNYGLSSTTQQHTKTVIAAPELQVSNSKMKRVVKGVTKATTTRWLPTESAVDIIVLNYSPLTQTSESTSLQRSV